MKLVTVLGKEYWRDDAGRLWKHHAGKFEVHGENAQRIARSGAERAKVKRQETQKFMDALNSGPKHQ